MLGGKLEKIYVMASLALLLCGCSSQAGSQKQSLNCENEYIQHKNDYSNIISKYSTSISAAQSALADLEKDILATIKRCNDNTQLYLLIADVEIAQGENQKALFYARRAENISPTMMETNYTLGNVLTLIGDYGSGIKYIERASVIAPDDIYIRANLCTNYEMAKRYKDAIKVCTEVIETRDPQLLGSALYVRGRAYKALGQLKKAELDFKRSKSEGFEGDKYYSKEHLEGGKNE